MNLKPGTQLAHYEILELIGKGGMGEVYRANDSKLGREVAIKVLPDEFAQDEERLRRFQREAKVLASLNHPNIAAIYGLEQWSPQPARSSLSAEGQAVPPSAASLSSEGLARPEDGRTAKKLGPHGTERRDTHYLVLELVEGETLAERIARGPIPLDEAMVIASKITRALERAHEQGIVHRDLKPANVKLTPDDDVKVLDFGLAKALVEDASAEGDSSMSPTITRDATRVGVILGTAAYMSPEQAKGKQVDRRTDIFAFGAVLFEMLSGRKAFPGQDISDVLASVLKLEPDWSALPRSVPPRLRDTLERCLEKDPAERRRDIGDVRMDMAEAVRAPDAPPPAKSHWRGAAVAAGVALVAGLALGLAVRDRGRETTPANDWRFSLDVGRGSFLDRPTDPTLALSPDGGTLAYTVYKGMRSQELHIRRMNELGVDRIPGTEGAKSPFFSPDGEWLGYFTFPSDDLYKVSLEGGAPVRLAPARFFWGGSWGVNGYIYFSSREIVYRVPAAGGEREVVLEPGSPPAAAGYRFPEVLPTGDAILVTASAVPLDFAESYIAILDLESGELRTVIDRGSHARYAPTGHLVYVRNGSLMAVGFDLESKTVWGDPVEVVADIAFTPDSGGGQFTFSNRGALAYVPPGPSAPISRIFWRRRDGSIEAPLLTIDNVQALRLSPDERSFVTAAEKSWPHLFVFDLRREILSRVTAGSSESQLFEVFPVWTPDSRRLTFSVDVVDQVIEEFSPVWVLADGSGPRERLAGSKANTYPFAWTSDEKTLVYVEATTESGWNIGTLSPGVSETTDLLISDANENEPALSPRDEWLAYTSDESGQREVYVQAFPGLGVKVKISADGGFSPRWSRDGHELFYRDGKNLMVVAIDTRNGFSAGRPEALFEDTVPPWMDGGYDVSADGQRFLTMETLPDGANKILFVPNWFDELERLVPSE